MARLAPLGLLLLLLLPGCAPAPQLYWHKPGATQQDFARDDYHCRRENTVTGSDTTYTPPNLFFPSGTVTTTPTVQVHAELFARCMNARGWYLREAESTYVQPAPTPPASSSPTAAPSSPSKKPAVKDVPLCPQGQYWSSVQRQCVKIGSE